MDAGGCDAVAMTNGRVRMQQRARTAPAVDDADELHRAAVLQVGLTDGRGGGGGLTSSALNSRLSVQGLPTCAHRT
jgi:hypothetical protein